MCTQFAQTLTTGCSDSGSDELGHLIPTGALKANQPDTIGSVSTAGKIDCQMGLADPGRADNGHEFVVCKQFLDCGLVCLAVNQSRDRKMHVSDGPGRGFDLSRRRPKGQCFSEQRWILSQHTGLKLLKARTGIDAQLFHQPSPNTTVGAERICLPAGGCVRAHKEFMHRFAQRMLSSKVFQLGESFGHASRIELQFQKIFGRPETKLVRARRSSERKGSVAKATKGRSSPMSERFGKHGSRLLRVDINHSTGSRNKRLNAQRVDGSRIHVEHIPGAGGPNPLASEYLAELGNPHRQRVERIFRRRRAPNIVDDLINTDHGTSIERKPGKHRAGAYSRNVDRDAGQTHFEWAQQMNLEGQEVCLNRWRLGHHSSDPSQETVNLDLQDGEMPDQSILVTAAIARLVGEDPLAHVLLAAAVSDHPGSFAANAALALVSDVGDDEASPTKKAIGAARRLAASRRDHQHLAIIECWLGGDADRARLLSREHLAEFPDDVIVSWLTFKR